MDIKNRRFARLARGKPLEQSRRSDLHISIKNCQHQTLKAESFQLVYKLYDLTPKEIKIVEGKD